MAALCTVNAIACAPVVRVGPDRDDTGWHSELGSPRHDASSSESLAADPQPLWRAAAGRAVRGGPAIGASVVAVGTSDRSVVLFDRKSGERLWRHHVPGTVAAGPLIAGAAVYVATQAVPDGRVLALRLKTGVPLWSVRTGGVSAGLALADSTIIAATDRGVVVALDARTGERRWERTIGRGIRAAPVVAPLGIAVATIADTIYLLDPGTGAIHARLATPGTIVGSPAADGKRLFAGTTAGHLMAIALPDLTVLWDRPVGDAVYGAPALSGDTLYAITDSGTLWRVPLAAAESARSFALGIPATAGPTPLANGVLVAGLTGEILLVDATTGAVRWRTRRRAPIEASPIVKDRELYLVTGNGVVEAYR
ncbi:MAG TPA: PQQ-binding-like beta-propeller repeat protein [Gemmatimonadales bacterium]|nr:PQQ-binding-like beta-propeller repeat protein [Gemmatimonadales bacterium]